MSLIKINCEHQKVINIDQIIPHDKNANTHSQKQIDLVASLLKKYGFRHSLIISKNSGKLVAGHCRLSACKKLGVQSVPVDYQEFKDEAEEVQFMIADNESARHAVLDQSKMIESLKDLEIDLESFDFEEIGLFDFNFQIAPMAELEDSFYEPEENQRYVIEVTFPNDIEMNDIKDDLISRGYVVKVKK